MIFILTLIVPLNLLTNKQLDKFLTKTHSEEQNMITRSLIKIKGLPK